MATGRQERGVLVAVLSGCAVLLAACATPGNPPVGTPDAGTSTGATGSTAGSAGPSTSPTDGMRPGVFPSTRVEPPSDAPAPNGPPPTPDGQLTAAQLAGLIRLDASAPTAPGQCAPDDVALALTGFDSAAGHRFAQIVATNTATKACTVSGWPGLGFRGDRGTSFPLIAEHETRASDRVGAIPFDPTKPVTIRPGGRATADLEWTGARAGATEESVSLIAVQLAGGGPVASLPAPAADNVDIGEATTVRVGRWSPSS